MSQRRPLVTDAPTVAPGAGWTTIYRVGEPFRSWPDGNWDVPIEETFVVPTAVRWERMVDGKKRMTADFVVVGDHPEERRVVCVRAEVVGSPDDPLSSTALRGLSLDDVGRTSVLALALQEVQPAWTPRTPEEEAALRAAGQPIDDSVDFLREPDREPVGQEGSRRLDRQLRGTRGRPPIPREELEMAAQIYKQAVAAGNKPVQAVQQHLGLDSAPKASRRVFLARKAGLLPPTKQGKAKG